MGASLRIELFVRDPDAFILFYRDVLSFSVVTDERQQDSHYIYVKRDSIAIGAAKPWETVNPENRRVPTGVEIVIEVDDIVAERDRVIQAGWHLETDLVERPWGLTDFRVHDPDGYYIRITNRRIRSD